MSNKSEKLPKIINTKVFCLALVLIAIVSSTSFGQSITWQRILNNGFGGIVKVQQTLDNGYVSFGSDYVNTPSVQWVTWIQKYNVFGDTVWKRVINERNFFCNWGEQTTDKGFIMCGEINDENSNSTDVFLYKTDSLGIKQWSKVIYSGIDVDQGYCVKQTSDGGYIVTFRCDNINVDAGIIKTDTFGNVSWTKIYLDNSNSQFLYEIKALAGDEYIAVGANYHNANIDVLLYRVNKFGDTTWTKNLGGSKNDVGYSIDLAMDDGFVVAGVTNSFNINEDRETYIIKTDTNGILEWQKTYKGFSADYSYSIRTKTNVGYVVVGSGDTLNELFTRAKIRLIDTYGNLKMINTYNPGNDENEFRTVEVTSDGGFITAGYTKSFPNGKQMFVVKMDSLLNSSPIGVSNEQIMSLSDFELMQNFPNPFNSSTTIKYYIHSKSYYDLILTDIQGQTIELFMNKLLDKGNYQIVIDMVALNLGSGVYFYTLSQNQKMITKKIVYLK